MARQKVTIAGAFLVGLTVRAERFPVAGETLIGTDFDMGPGGKGSNQAVQAARMGADVSFVGVIGDDDFGRIGLDLYDAEGIDASLLQRSPERNTGVGFIILDSAGQNRIVIAPGATDLFSPEHIAAARRLIEESAVVVTGLEIPVETAAAAMAAGRAAGALTILNPAPARPVPVEMLADVDLLTPNQSEARILLDLAPDADADEAELCRRLMALGVRTVVMTRGSQGALIASDKGIATVPAFEVGVIDTTGAGDAFNGTLAASLALRSSIDDGARRACAAGALACTRLGVIPALPRAADVEGLLA